MIEIVRAHEHYHFQNDWLSSFWHFSFDEFYDPNKVAFGALRVFNDDTVQPNRGFGTHSHREMEIVTYVISGRVAHRDSTGSQFLIQPGEAQRMSAGTGISHSEMNPDPDEPVHFLQIWIIPAEKGIEPSYEQKGFPRDQRQGVLLPIVSGQGIPGGLRIHQDTTFYVSCLNSGDSVTHHLASAARKSYLFVIEGKIQLNGEVLQARDVARLTAHDDLQIKASESSELILLDLP
ncbi:MAG: pirin family protein [Candidatus Tectomicrobia bacterium]|uniref:Pirin family protein n=1 Tax=Tectimicrobiota bacterium TaxID=2528274 RepID=A0A932M1E5_UNCTE|nr:pirin family protein [Candidatus Tectomicrobia bacterium]